MGNQTLQKTMGLKDYFMLGFGSMVGVGWAVALSSWIASGGGVMAALIGYAIATLCMIPVGLCYSEMTPAMPVAGGVVAFTYKAFGTFVSFVAGWFVVLAYVNILPWEAIYINTVLSLIIPGLKDAAGNPVGPVLYELGGEGIYLYALILGILVSCVVIFLNWRGTKLAVKFQTFCTMIILIAGGCVIVFGLLRASTENLMPFYKNIDPNQFSHFNFGGGLLAVFAMAPFFLAGFDTIPQGAEEGSSGLNFKNLGKVLLGSVLAAGVFYILIILCAGMAYPWTEFAAFSRPALPRLFTTLYPGVLGTILYWVAMIGALAGLFTTWNGFFIAGARLILGMGRARLLPEFFSRIHPRYGTPIGGNLICGIATLAGPFIGIGLIDPLTIIGSSAFVIGWFFTCLAAFKLRRSQPDMKRPFKMPGGAFTAILGAIISFLLFAVTIIPASPGFMGKVGVYYLTGWVVLGVIFWFASGKYRNSVPEKERTKSLFHSMNEN